MGKRATELILAEPAQDGPEEFIFDPELIVRRSWGTSELRSCAPATTRIGIDGHASKSQTDPS